MACSWADTNPADFFFPAFRTCQQGVMHQIKPNLAKEPMEWDASATVTCDLEEVCQETLLLIDVGAWAVHQGRTTAQRPGSPVCILSPELLEFYTSLFLFLHLAVCF